MASSTQAPAYPTLDRITDVQSHTFSTPVKKINDTDGLNYFLSSTAYRDIMTWLLQLNRSMFPTKDGEGNIHHNQMNKPPPYSNAVRSLKSLMSELSDLIEKAPPDTGPRRFGNVAFRTWFSLVEDGLDGLFPRHLGPILQRCGSDEQKAAMKGELKVYLLGSLGSSQRLDYGTGHELSFLAFLACLWKLNAFEDGEERAIVIGVVQPYLTLIRRLVLTYTLEPAGSHGVWGLDDHSFVPYILGSAQYGPAITPTSPTPTEGSVRSSPSPSKVTDRDAVADYKDMNMYFSAIQFIYDVKTGPFGEHSSVLYSISGIKDGWGKINKGMIKMYAAEVLGKFPVVQHFPFGSLFAWERDPMARVKEPVAGESGGEAVGDGVGTKAPWATNSGSNGPAVQTGMGMPSTRAPWAGGVATNRQPPAPGMAPTAAPWAATQRPGSGAVPTAAPWTSTQRTQPGGNALPPRKNGG